MENACVFLIFSKRLVTQTRLKGRSQSVIASCPPAMPLWAQQHGGGPPPEEERRPPGLGSPLAVAGHRGLGLPQLSTISGQGGDL